MSFETPELSVQDGAPAELLTFTYGTVTYRHINAPASRIIGGELYTSESFSIPNVASSAERARNSIDISVRRDHPIALLFRVTPPTQVITVTYGKVHNTDLTEEVLTPFVGRVLNCDWAGIVGNLNCEPISQSQKRNGNCRKYGRTCTAALYSCGVQLADFESATTVSSVSGLVLNVAAVNPAYTYRGGFVTWTDDDGNDQYRYIDGQTTTALTLTIPFQGIAATDAVRIAPGCDRSLATCNAVFGNGLNYPAFPLLPTKNPFDGTPIY